MVRFLTVALLLLSTIVHAEDWPRWRGPNNDNMSVETGLLSEWPTGGPDRDWLTSGLGTGYSSVAVAQGKIFTLGRTDNVEYLYALKQSDGSQLWSARLGAGSKEKGPNGTPTVDGDRV